MATFAQFVELGRNCATLRAGTTQVNALSVWPPVWSISAAK